MRLPIYTRQFAAGLAFLACLPACTDVTTEPKSTVTSANIFNESSSYKAYLAKLYGGLAVSGQSGPAGSPDISGIDEGFSQYLRLYWQMEELPTDEAVLAWNDAGSQELNTQLWSSSNQFLGAMYSRVFFQVSLANEFLRETTDEKLASRGVTGQLLSDVHQYRAEARFLRALSYWHGIDLFGDIPLVTDADPLSATPPKPSTRQAIFSFIESELKDIAGQLPAAGAGEYARADQGAVNMLLATLYLNAEVYTGTARYSDALAAAQRVIASGAYSLDPSYQHLFLADNNTSKEIIWAVAQDGLKTQSYGGTTFIIHASIGGSMNAGSFGMDGGWYGTRARPELVTLFPSTSPSPDRRAIFYTDGQTLGISELVNYNDGLGVTKWRNVTSTGAAGSNPSFADTDFPVFRLAEAYLIYAEAVVRGAGGSRAQALTYVNALRERAYGNTSGNVTDAQLDLGLIKAERARELYWEAKRRTDLVRFNQFSTAGVWTWKGGVIGGKVTDASRNLYPLPATELVANPNLKQNPGY
jgi:starch-binding outer membrane protein, SusD/RagB family